MNQTWENEKKSSFGPDFGPFSPNSGRQNLFPKNLDLLVTRYHGQVSSYTISEKNNDAILRKLSNRRTDGQKDRQMKRPTDGLQWFQSTLSKNVEHPI